MVPELIALSKKEKDLAIPPTGEKFTLAGLIWEVTYRHPGKLRFSAELVGAVPPEMPDEEGSEGLPFGVIVTDDGKGQENVTLDVKSGEMGATANFKK